MNRTRDRQIQANIFYAKLVERNMLRNSLEGEKTDD